MKDGEYLDYTEKVDFAIPIDLIDRFARRDPELTEKYVDDECRKFAKNIGGMIVSRKYPEPEDDTEPEDEGEKEPKSEIDLDSVSPEEIRPSVAWEFLDGIANTEPSDGEQCFKVCMAMVALNNLEPAYNKFSDGCEEYPGLDKRTCEFGEYIADCLAYCYIKTEGHPTYGHVDILASCCPDGPAVFFSRFGKRIMDHLSECFNAIVASDIPDVFAMYSRFIFDFYDVEGIAGLFAEVADAYDRTSNYILRNKKRFGPNSEHMISVCEHCRKVYEGMSKYLEKEFEDKNEFFMMPPIIAGHDFDALFANWFQFRHMQGRVVPNEYTEYMIRNFNGLLRGFIYKDDEDNESEDCSVVPLRERDGPRIPAVTT